MQELSVEELKTIELRLLAQLHAICQQEGLRYTLAEGTLLGAVRHRGFIPWDDDIDLAMPRPDYEKLINYCQNHETPFRLICNKTDARYGYLFAKIAAPDTVLVEEYARKDSAPMGVYIDIFPVDGMGASLREARKRFNARSFARELLVAANWGQFFRSSHRPWYHEPIRFAFFVLSRLVSRRKLVEYVEHYYAKQNFDESVYVASMCTAYRSKEIFLKSCYDDLQKMPFEGVSVMGIEKYDEYLTQLYGDYMQLPPEEKRVTHHIFSAYRKE